MRNLLFFFFFFLLNTFCPAQKSLSSYQRAKLHAIEIQKPATNFFEGALLGNGGMGAVVTTRPDGVLVHFGHNNVWDIRVSENNKAKIGTFNEVFNKIKLIPDTLKLLTEDKWYLEYSNMTQENYRKPYPRPFPCGSLLLGFDRRKAELLGHKLDVSNGMCEVYILVANGDSVTLQLFMDMSEDKLLFRLVDQDNNLYRNIFDRVRLIPDPETPTEFPKFKIQENLDLGYVSFLQILPFEEPENYNKEIRHPKDKFFRLSGYLYSTLEKTKKINWSGVLQDMNPLEVSFPKEDGFLLGCVSLEEGLYSDLNTVDNTVVKINDTDFDNKFLKNNLVWEEYWKKSGVFINDDFLEQIWYRNLYFFNCAVKKGVSTPGLFANWSYRNIGTAWHGDYHMNYNTQQPFWLTYSSNHLDKNLSYVELIEFLMNISKKWAEEYYNLPGAFFPHSAYPVEMSINPYPVPTWGWQVSETPWAVQGLWWHYLYSGDVDFLKNRAFEPIKAAVEFLVAYMKRPVARGNQWGDNNYHIFSTVPPELYGLRPGFKNNYDCNVDLSLTKFIFKAFIEAANILDKNLQEKKLIDDINDILLNYPEYPTAISEEYGEVLVSTPSELSNVVYNVPLPLFAVFPGEDHEFYTKPESVDIVRNSFRNQQNEGGNDLIMLNFQAARIGMLDLDKFKRQISYCLLPNGTASDRVLQVNGRYNDLSNYGYMDNMGIWFENFALPAVINECLLQSYNNNLIKLFPNWSKNIDAEFHTLRTKGGFLISASLKDGMIEYVEIISEVGGSIQVELPWIINKKLSLDKNSHTSIMEMHDKTINLQTEKGDVISIRILK